MKTLLLQVLSIYNGLLLMSDSIISLSEYLIQLILSFRVTEELLSIKFLLKLGLIPSRAILRIRHKGFVLSFHLISDDLFLNIGKEVLENELLVIVRELPQLFFLLFLVIV